MADAPDLGIALADSGSGTTPRVDLGGVEEEAGESGDEEVGELHV